jgi:hypothetical protein
MHPWSASDISSIILRSQHTGVSLSPPSTPTRPGPIRSTSGVRAENPAAQPHHAAKTDAQLQFRPITDAAANDSTRDYLSSHTAASSRKDKPPSGSSAGAPHARPVHLPAASYSAPHASPPAQNTSAATVTSHHRALLHTNGTGRTPDSTQEAEASPPLLTSGSRPGLTSAPFGHTDQSAPLFSAPTPRRSSAAGHDIPHLDDAEGAAEEREVLYSLRKQAISNEVELLRQRLAIVHLELHNRNKDYELLQRVAAVSEYRAEAAERALADLQQQVEISADAKSRLPQRDASTTISEEFPSSPLRCNFGSISIDAGTQTPAAAAAESSGMALLQRLVAVPSPLPGTYTHATSVSPQKHASQKSSVSLEHVNAKADHLAEKLEELLFNMSVQQREFSKLSRAASGLFRTLIQTLQAVAHCYSILSGGHDEQVPQRRYMVIERELEGRDVGVFASEACVLIEDAIEAVNLVNMLRAPRTFQTGKK